MQVLDTVRVVDVSGLEIFQVEDASVYKIVGTSVQIGRHRRGSRRIWSIRRPRHAAK